MADSPWGRSSRSSRGRNWGTSAPQPACVTGPRQAMPRATAMQTLPLRLHSSTRCTREYSACVRERRGDQFDELILVDRAAAQLEIDRHVLGDRGGELERADELRRGVHHADEFVDVLPVAQRLNAAGGGARSNGDERLALPPHFLNAVARLWCVVMEPSTSRCRTGPSAWCGWPRGR